MYVLHYTTIKSCGALNCIYMCNLYSYTISGLLAIISRVYMHSTTHTCTRTCACTHTHTHITTHFPPPTQEPWFWEELTMVRGWEIFCWTMLSVLAMRHLYWTVRIVPDHSASTLRMLESSVLYQASTGITNMYRAFLHHVHVHLLLYLRSCICFLCSIFLVHFSFLATFESGWCQWRWVTSWLGLW